MYDIFTYIYKYHKKSTTHVGQYTILKNILSTGFWSHRTTPRLAELSIATTVDEDRQVLPCRCHSGCCFWKIGWRNELKNTWHYNMDVSKNNGFYSNMDG